jgi:hypothetical protein
LRQGTEESSVRIIARDILNAGKAVAATPDLNLFPGTWTLPNNVTFIARGRKIIH